MIITVIQYSISLCKYFIILNRCCFEVNSCGGMQKLPAHYFFLFLLFNFVKYDPAVFLTGFSYKQREEVVM